MCVRESAITRCGSVYHILPVAEVAYQVIFEPGIRQFREFESPRVHMRIISWRLFLAHNLTCGKPRERE